EEAITAPRSAAALFLLLPISRLAQPGRYLGELLVHLGEGRAAFRLLIHSAKAHGELQEIVGRLRAVGIILVAFKKGRGGIGEIAPHIESLAKPVLRISGKLAVLVRSEEHTSEL